jgi:N-hydroxyarylamine O-acetyltransferase
MEAATRTGDVDAEAYLERVGLAPTGLAPTVDALHRLHRAHVDRIPFDNVVPALGGVPALDLPTLQRRLVGERRGGYCLEHVTLFAAVLRALGFRAQRRLSLVGDPAQIRPGRPPTHLTVLADVADDDRRWMADVGFGVGVLGPVPVPVEPGEGEPVRHGSWELRADRTDDGRILLHEHAPDGWRLLHTTSDAEPEEATIAEANRWVALDPSSPFAGRLRAMRTTDDRRERLLGTRLEIAGPDGDASVTDLTPAEALETFVARFRGVADGRERDALLRLLEAESTA